MKRLAWLTVASSMAAFALFAACSSSSDSLDDTVHKEAGVGGSSGSAGTSQNGGKGGSSASGGSSAAAGTGANDGNAGTAGTGASSGSGGSLEDASTDVDFKYDAPTLDSNLTEDSACATVTAEAELMPLDIYIMLDKSGSMGNDCNVGQSTSSKWCRAINALAGYVQDPSAAGNRVALHFFSGTGNCDGAHYANPVVTLGLLPGNVNNIIAALNAAAPSGNTPTEGALNGIAQYTAANQTSGRVMIGILITDGDPVGCETDTGKLQKIRQNHFDKTGIRIFSVGMTGATYAKLEQIATGAGIVPHSNYCGTNPPCHHYDVKNGDPAAFIAALKEIQQAAVACQFKMPQTNLGVIDIEQVKIEYTPSNTGIAEELPRVSGAGDCGASGGWYYDNNTSPSFLNLCDATCDLVRNDPAAKIQVLLGCLGS